MSSLKEYVWDYDHLSVEDHDNIRHAERYLVAAITCMVNKFPGLKIGATKFDAAEHKLEYHFCTVFGDIPYVLVHDTTYNVYSILSFASGKRIIKSQSYGYFCRNINKPWKNDDVKETAEKLSDRPKHFYSHVLSEIRTHKDYAKENIIGTRSLAKLAADICGRFSSSSYIKSELVELQKLFNAAFGVENPLNFTSNPHLSECFDDIKTYFQISDAYDSNFRVGRRLVVSNVRTKDHYLVVRFENLIDPYTPEHLISVEYIRGTKHLKSRSDIMAHFAILDTYTEQRAFDAFTRNELTVDKGFPDIRTLSIGLAHGAMFIFSDAQP